MGQDQDGSKKIKPAIWRTVSRREALKTPIFTITAVRREHPEREGSAEFFTISPPDWVNVIALTTERRVVLVRQYRHGTSALTLEIPGGSVDPDETPEEAGARELREETGYKAERWVRLGRIEVNPAFMSNGCTTLLALEARLTGETAFDEHEELSVELFTVEEFFDAIDSGLIDHGIVVSAAYYLRRYLEMDDAPAS